eukprot:Partr_v1_DN28720_c0_g1_i1_m62895 putative ras homolog family member
MTESERRIPRTKVVIIGDGSAGKTSLLSTFTRGQFPIDYVPTIFENTVHQFELDNHEQVELELWDTAGQEEYSRLRTFAFDRADVVLIAFALDCPQSLDNVREKWISEVMIHCPEVPIILVGLKSDSRDADGGGREVVSYERAKTAAANMTSLYIGPRRMEKYRKRKSGKQETKPAYQFPYMSSIMYCECSSKLNKGIRDVFEHACRAALLHKRIRDRRVLKNDERFGFKLCEIL